MSVTAIVGAQFGSEGKGVVVNKIANKYGIHVRTGGPNAGHSFFHKGREWKMQSVPCGWVNSSAVLYIGPGAVVSMDILRKELREIYEVDPTVLSRIFIDPRAGVLSQEHHDAEGGVAGDLHQKIGSTGEGVGACRVARMMRDPTHFQQMESISGQEIIHGLRVGDTLRDIPGLLSSAIFDEEDILLEGTQGFGLSLVHGPWPKVTSADTCAMQLAADAGVGRVDEVILVARTMPIRVAGNSGPLRDETTWADLSTRLGREVQERTTVTKKVRRIGEWDHDLFVSACQVNLPTEIAVTFLDYLNPKDHGVTEFEDLSDEAREFLRYVSNMAEAPVTLAGTGYSERSGWSCVEMGGE